MSKVSKTIYGMSRALKGGATRFQGSPSEYNARYVLKDKFNHKRACLLCSRILHLVLSDTFFGAISTKFGENTLIDMGQLL